MYRTLRKQSFIAVLPRLIVCAVLAVALLAVSIGGLLKMATGPKQLSGSIRTGDYVSFDASEIIVAFANLTSKNTEGSSTTIKTYYLLPDGNGSYLAVVDFMDHHQDVIERAMDQSHEYYLGDLETLTTLGTVVGTVKSLESDMESYMTDCIDEYQLPGYEDGQDSGKLLIPYQVELDKVGFLSKTQTLLIGGAGLAFLLLFAVQLILVLCGAYQKKVRAVIGNDFDEDDFQNAVKLERIRVGKHIWYNQGPGSRAVRTADLLCGYPLPEPLVISKYRWSVALYTEDLQNIRLSFMEQKNCNALLNAIARQNPDFQIGAPNQTEE